MRSWRSLLVGVVALAACGNDVATPGGDDEPLPHPDACATSFLAYDNFGEPFIANWCRGCHASAVPAGMRQDAPLDVNFDTDADVRTWAERIRVRSTGATPTMPPAGGPSAEERALLAEWLACGAK